MAAPETLNTETQTQTSDHSIEKHTQTNRTLQNPDLVWLDFTTQRPPFLPGIHTRQQTDSSDVNSRGIENSSKHPR